MARSLELVTVFNESLSDAEHTAGFDPAFPLETLQLEQCSMQRMIPQPATLQVSHVVQQPYPHLMYLP